MFPLDKIFASSFVEQHCFALSSSEKPSMSLDWRNYFLFHVCVNGWNQELTRSQGMFVEPLKLALQTSLRCKSWVLSSRNLQYCRALRWGAGYSPQHSDGLQWRLNRGPQTKVAMSERNKKRTDKQKRNKKVN